MTYQPTNPTFNPAIPSFSGFDDLGEIDEPRTVQVREKTTLDKLLKIEQRLVTNYKPRRGEHFKIYQKLYPQIREELNTFPFTEDDLRSLILTKANSNYCLAESQMLGLYTGMLLHLLTERNQEQGKRTSFYINGNGNRFDYLFLYAQFVDEVIVDNFVGQCICHNIASDGRANRIVGMNIEGQSPLLWCGEGGVVSQIIGINIKGDNVFDPPFSSTRIAQVVAVNIEVEEKSPTLHLKHHARYGQAVCVDINGLFHFLCSYKCNTYPIVNQLVYDNVSDIYKTSSCRKLITLGSYSTWLHHPFIMLFQKAKIQKTIDLTRSLRDAAYPDVLKIADELYALRPRVSESFFRKYDDKRVLGLENLERLLSGGV